MNPESGTTMEHGHQEPNYMAIWIWLGVLTILEVLVAVTRVFPWAVVVGLLIGMAVVKALLVAMYFMHLRFERSTLILICTSPVALSVILFVALLPDTGGG